MRLYANHSPLSAEAVGESVPPSRWEKAKRAVLTHTMVASLVAVLVGGLSAQQAQLALAEQAGTYQQLAVYAGCAHKDQVGNFAWKPFPTTMDETTGEPLVAPKAAKRKK